MNLYNIDINLTHAGVSNFIGNRSLYPCRRVTNDETCRLNGGVKRSEILQNTIILTVDKIIDDLIIKLNKTKIKTSKVHYSKHHKYDIDFLLIDTEVLLFYKVHIIV